MVHCIFGNGDVVGVVWISRFNFGYEILIPEHLCNVSIAPGSQRAVAVNSRVDVDDHVVVIGAASVVSWKDAFKSSNAILIRRLNTAEEGGIDVGKVRAIAIATLDYTTIDSCCVTIPAFALETKDTTVR